MSGKTDKKRKIDDAKVDKVFKKAPEEKDRSARGKKGNVDRSKTLDVKKVPQGPKDDSYTKTRKRKDRKMERNTIAGIAPISSNTTEEELQKMEENFHTKTDDRKKFDDKKKSNDSKKWNDHKQGNFVTTATYEYDEDTPTTNTHVAGENLATNAVVEAVLLDLEADVITEEFLNDLSAALQSDDDFRHGFLAADGFNKLSFHLVKARPSLTAQILDLLLSVFDDKVVITTLFGESAVMLTTLIWLLVKSRADPLVSSKVYNVLAGIPAAAKAANFEAQMMLLNSLDLYNYKSGEGRRFQHLLQGLQQGATPELQVSILRLVNVLIDMYEDVDSRIGIRTEFLALGLADILDALSTTSHEELAREISSFREKRHSDEEAFSKLTEHIVLAVWRTQGDLRGLTDALVQRIQFKPVQMVAMDIFTNLIRISTDQIVGIPKWLLISKLVSQIAGNRKHLSVDGRESVNIREILQAVEESEAARRELQEARLHITNANAEISSLKEELARVRVSNSSPVV